ncbi:mechanosensitive ion channel domain-containing protein [Rhodoferax sp.]|uniref:mechanosensitive ion channel family protein n=1 Tax=Rhodoferax sp. TaxID=50421 RepID=UPI0026231281|nr:mechanosensitive ion channel domain-containing protein [Rhodoferax sp.]MDD2925035.1 mechanosensitive ion channel [Rhodoferax sp.]
MSDARLTGLDGWLAALAQTSALMELAALLGCALLAWLLSGLVARAFVGRPANSIMFGRRIVDGVLFPALWLCLAYLARKLVAQSVPLAVFKLAVPVLLALLMIRLGVKVLQAAFDETPLIRLLERTISWVAWLAMVLWVSGLLPLLMEELDQISWRVGGTQLSVRKIIEGSLTAGLVLIITLWISSAIESRLLRSATGSELSLRKAVSNATRALLMFVGLLLALSAVGIDLTALSVLGGAVGVGIGFGLQKLAANYVSGFVILAERSMRIGDSVMVDNFTGIVTQINARYTVIRSLSGRESIVPNELLITSRVENLSLADPKVWQSTEVSVGYDSDVELVSRLLLQAATAQARVLRDPAPAVALMAFGADGLAFRLGYWIADPENGSDNLRSLVNLEILRLLREHRIDIPYPQRVIHQRSA